MLGQARRARPQLQHRRSRWTPCTPLPATCSSSSPSRPRRPPPAGPTRSPSTSTPARTTPRASGDLVLRQQPRVLDDERRVRAEEGPGPEVVRRAVPVVGHRLHRRAHAVRRLPGEGVASSARSTRAGFPKDMYYLFRSQWTDEPMVHLLPMNWTDHQPGDEVEVWAYSNVDTRRAVPQRQVPRHPDLRPQEDHRRPDLPGDHRGDRRRQDRHRRPLPRQLHQPERQRRQAPPDLEGAVRAGRAEGGRPAGRHGRRRRPVATAGAAARHGSRRRSAPSPRAGSRWPSSTSTSSTRTA